MVLLDAKGRDGPWFRTICPWGEPLSLRFKFVLALLLTSLLSIAVMWWVAHERVMRRFNHLVQSQSSVFFRADAASWWLTYGSWDAAMHAETFFHFEQRRKLHARLSPLGSINLQDAQVLAPVSDDPVAAKEMSLSPAAPLPMGPPLAKGENPAPGFLPPFRFLLFDVDGKVILNPTDAYRPGDHVSDQDRENAIPIEVNRAVVGYASSVGELYLSPSDHAFLDAMLDALIWGCSVAAALAVVVGLLVGSGLSASLRGLTTAIRGMQDGALGQSVKVSSGDEIGLLAQAFNSMSDEVMRSHEALKDSHAKISEQARQLQELSIRDSMTELFNRRHFDKGAQRLFDLAGRYGHPLTLMIGDIDLFKQVNDRFSHAVGDAVLKEIATILLAATRTTDLVARYGGEEFVIAFAETSVAEAEALCERLRRAIEGHSWAAIDPKLAVTMSMGLCGDLSFGSAEAMLNIADQRLYMAKGQGRNRIVGQS